MVHRDACYVAAAVQGILGWEWLVSGANKVLSGSFPAGLAATLDDGIKSNPNGWYVSVLQNVILPHSVFFGYIIEITEVLAGLALLSGALVLIGGIRRRGEPQYRLAVAQIVAASLAALACAFLCINFHFYMGDGILPGINRGNPFNEGVDLDTLMPPLALLILTFNLFVLSDASGIPIAEFPRRAVGHVRAFFARGRLIPSRAVDGAAR